MSNRALGPVLGLILLATGCGSATAPAPSVESPAASALPVAEAPQESVAPSAAAKPPAPRAAPSLAPPPSVAPKPRPTTACSAPANEKELAADKQLLAQTAAASIAVAVDRQCAGYS